MPHILKNNNLEVHIDLPQENYNLSRFDWTGKIVHVKFNGKSVTGNEITDQTKSHLFGKGFYNEFGIKSPVGYHETEPGSWFHKIGIGLLKRDESEYDFNKSYEIIPAEFNYQLNKDELRITCQSQSVNGYSYFLEKKIELFENGFAIKYKLKNTGYKTITTDEYNHNFIAIDNDSIGRHYTMKFPFRIKPELFEENINPEGLVEIGQEIINFKDTPKNDFFFSKLSGRQLTRAEWKIVNTKKNIEISETGDFQTSQVNLWGCGHVVSPELFFSINLQAGHSVNWSRVYNICNFN